MKLDKHVILNGIIHCKTGLRIGGPKDDIEIGGMDNPIIRNPLTGLPYIPGSSLKGRIRSLLELKYSEMSQRTGHPCQCGDASCKVCKIFGPHKNTTHQLGPTRIIVRDADLTETSKEILKDTLEEKGINYAEIKAENWVDRKTGVAGEGGLRTQERVPAGTEFDFEIVIRIFENDDEKEIIDFIAEGMSMLEKEYLGSSGSRGYGKIKFMDLSINGEPFQLPGEK